MTVTEAVRTFSDVINRAHYRDESTLLVKNGVPVARVVPVGTAPVMTAREIASRLAILPRLGSSEAKLFERDVKEARRRVRKPAPPRWG